jgi:hypothetical protein
MKGSRAVVQEDNTPTSVETAREQNTGRPPVLDLVGGVLGLIVFFVGIAIIVSVYSRASAMYGDIAPAIQQASMGSDDDADEGSDSADAGPVVARPGGTPLSKVAAELGFRFLWLILIAFFGALVSAMGAKLAGAYRGKRT